MGLVHCWRPYGDLSLLVFFHVESCLIGKLFFLYIQTPFKPNPEHYCIFMKTLGYFIAMLLAFKLQSHYTTIEPRSPRSKINSDRGKVAVWAAWKCKFSLLSRCYYVLITLLQRSRYDYTTFSPRLFWDPTTFIKIFLRSSRSHYDHTTNYSIATRSYHASSAIIARPYHDYITFIPRSYYVLSNNVNIVFNINIVPFLLFLIYT